MIGGRLLPVRDAIGHPANDWLSALGWCPETPSQVRCIRVTRTVRFIDDGKTGPPFVPSFVRHKTPLEPVFREADEPEVRTLSRPESPPRGFFSPGNAREMKRHECALPQ